MGDDSTLITVITKKPERAPGAREACFVVINGDDLGKKYTLSQNSTLIGRSSKVDIQIDEDSISRNHAVVEYQDDDFVLRDLNSTNGTYVNDSLIAYRPLADGDQVKIGHTIFKFLSGSNVESMYHDEIYKLTTTDGLTGAYNKRHFLRELERELSRSLRYGRDLSLLLCDIDLFKRVNDTYGHLAGDFVLRQVSRRLLGHTRRDDVVARYGGEEFAILLPEVPKRSAAKTAQKLRRVVASDPFLFDEISIPVTLSIGVVDLAEYRQAHGAASEELDIFGFIKLADDRLYEAKGRGRNQVVDE